MNNHAGLTLTRPTRTTSSYINAVTGMEAEQIIESLANYAWFLRAPNSVCISHLLLIDRSTPVDL